MKIISLRNLEFVACLFQRASLLNKANDPTHELIVIAAINKHTVDFNPFVFILFGCLFIEY
jgi:hypothetical protein